MAGLNFNPLSTMNMLTMTQHLNQHFNNFKMDNSTSVFSQDFVNQTSLLFLQIFLVSLFSGFSNYFSSSFETVRTLIGNYIRRFFSRVFGPVIRLVRHTYKFITRQRPKYTIRKNISLITGANIRNGEMFQILQWFINSKFCIKKQKEINLDSQDMTKWELTDRLSNKFNRLVLYRGDFFHMSLDYFGQDINDGRLFQTFFFDTER